MDPYSYNNSAAGYNNVHRSTNSNPNSQQLVNNATSATAVPVPPRGPSNMSPAAVVAGMQYPAVANAGGYNNNPQGNAQYRMAAAAAAVAGLQYGGQQQQQSVPQQQHQPQQQAAGTAPFASPSRQPMYNPRTPAAAGGVVVGSPSYSSVPNPLGLGGGGGGVPPAPVAAVAPTGPSKTDLLRSMYQSRGQQRQPQPTQQQQQQPAANYGAATAGIQQQQQGMQLGANTAYAGVPNMQQQQQAANYRQGMSAQPTQQSVQQVQNYQQQQRSTPQMTPHQLQLQQQQQQQQQRQQMTSQSMQHSQHNPQSQRQQVGQQASQQVYQQQQVQQQSNRMNMQQQQYSQQQQPQQQVQQGMVGQQQQQQPSRQGISHTVTSQAQPQRQQQQQQPVAASSHPSSSSSQQQAGSSSSSKHRFHLTPEAKVTLREAVLSAIRHPAGEVDPGCLQRAMAQGLPKQAILNAAVVARQRDQRNREQRRQQQQQGVVGGGQQQVGSRQSVHQQQPVGHSASQQQQQRQPPQQVGTLVHNPGLARNTGAPPSYPPPTNANTQQLYSNQPKTSGVATQYNPAQYSQTAQQQQQVQQNRIYQQQQQAAQQQAQQQRAAAAAAQQQQQAAQQQQQRQQQLQQQQQTAAMTKYQRQLQAQQVTIAHQRKLAEDARKKKQLELQYKQEQQRRAAETQRRQQAEAQQRKMLEEQKRKAAAEALAKRNAVLMGRMKPWGRTGFGLVVRQCAGGLPLPQPPQQPPGAAAPAQSRSSRAVLRQSTWGGTSMCQDKQSALVGALKRHSNKDGKDGTASLVKKLNVAPEKLRAAADLIRQRLQIQSQPLLKDDKAAASTKESPTREQLRQKRTKSISSKLLPPHSHNDQLKRHKLQPKRESKFLDKHIRRARQMTADSHSKRHKELLKSIIGHQSEFYKFHRGKKNESAKLARTIRDQLKKVEAAKEKEADQAEKARLAALRANDMAAYTSLLEDTKNERLKFLLDKTDECMNQISTLLESRVAEEEEDIKRMGGEGTVKATFSENVSGGSYYETAHVKSEQVRQPSILTGGELKEYQMGGLQWMVSLYNNRLNGILADEMGLGKTIQTIALIAYLIEVKQNLGPYLVIVPLSTLSNWVNEFAKWLPAATVVCYKGTPQQRKQLFRDEVSDGHFNVLLTTYEFVIRDKGSLKKLEWQYAIVDEGHRMKNNQSKFSVTLGTHYNTRRRVLLTGTPLQNSLPELWALLNFLLPAIFNSADTFDQWFNKPFASFGKAASPDDESSNELLSNEERMLIIHRLHELLRPFMLRRVKSEVLDQLPTKVEKVIRCELSSWQKELYKQISHKIAGEAATKNFNRGLNNVVMQLRKVCNHPYLFSQDGYHMNEDIIRTSGKLELLDRMLPKLKAAGHRVLMFTQMTKMMPILEDYFAYRGFSSLRLDGSTTADEREKRMYTFNAPDSPYFIFLLSTRAGGLGLNLATADTVIIFDSDWNPMMDLQAQDRAHRIGQRRDVRVFRIITQTPVEEKILSRATEKLQMNELVVEAGKFDKSGQGKEDNSLERLKMMELLLTDFDEAQNAKGAATSEEDFDKDTDDGEEEDNKDLLNEMISSNDDDYKMYCKMDMERTDAVSLFSDVNDCPDWIRYPNGKPEEGAELVDDSLPEILGKRRAAAGDIKYDDGLTEKQFCRMMDKQATAEEKGKKKRKKKRNRNAVDPSLILENDGGGRKRSKVNHLELDDTSSRSKAGTSSGGGGAGNGEVTAAMYDRLLSITRSIIYFKEKTTKRKLSEIFLEKPCPQTYPDYYQVIDKPIGMNDILRKCRAKLYSSVNDFREDWNQLFKNAVTYNGEGSWIVVDSEVLKGELDRLMDKNALSASAAATKKPIRIKLSMKKGKKKKPDGENGTPSPAPAAGMKTSESQSELSKTADSSDDSDSNTEGYSDIVGMDEREASLSKRGKIRSGGPGSRGGTTRLVRRSG